MHVHKINACTFKFIKNQTYACMHTTLKNGLKMLKIGTDSYTIVEIFEFKKDWARIARWCLVERPKIAQTKFPRRTQLYCDRAVLGPACLGWGGGRCV